MKYLEKHPLLVIVIGVIGISMSGILVRYSQAPSAVTAAGSLLIAFSDNYRRRI